MAKLNDLLMQVVDRKASDLFIKPGGPPHLRIDGVITPMETAALSVGAVEDFAREMLNQEQWEQFYDSNEMDVAHSVAGLGRFRVNCYRQRGSVGIVMRLISNISLSFEDLNLPDVVRQLAERPRGMALLTGMTGSGKSTTLAAMVNHINRQRRCHIVTIEDPIEFLHDDDQAIVNQREVGMDTLSFHSALRHVLRQSPDVILIGEMRDLETIQTAISASETGHLVLSTLHTTDAVQTVERIINFFPAHTHNQIRLELSLCLNGVVCERLLPCLLPEVGRIPAVEVMINTPTIRKILQEGRIAEMIPQIAGGEYYGMMTFNQSLLRLINEEKISYETALNYATSPEEMRLAYEGMNTGASTAQV